MYYIDTSVLVAYYSPEPLSGKAEAFLLSNGRPVISALTEVEVFSALARKVREHAMTKAEAVRIKAKFISHIESGMYSRLTVEPHHYKLAGDWIGLFKWNLRTLDALHLAIVSSEGLPIVTADQVLAKSAAGLGLEAVRLA
jgi:uncharacterized protein